VKPEVNSLKFIGCLTSLGTPTDNCLTDYDGLLEKGRRSPSSRDQFEERRKQLDGKKIAAIIYTSGTTGNPKGVVLNQDNFKAQTDMLISTPVLQKILARGIRLESLCFLPLCHVMARTSDYHLQMALGTTITFAESMDEIQSNLLEVKPQILFSVPRLFEKIYEAVKLYSIKLTGIQKKIFDRALNIGDKASDYMIEGSPLPPALGIKFALSNALVFDKIRKTVEFDRLIVAGSGGGALPADITKFFRSMNITGRSIKRTHLCRAAAGQMDI